ncbi:hypothetical protein [Treponema endosymbiont of Eucomonympha sp.]|nr:hypothetical protein [Treponema endosymbiont of Eucomonympha sp.]
MAKSQDRNKDGKRKKVPMGNGVVVNKTPDVKSTGKQGQKKRKKGK